MTVDKKSIANRLFAAAESKAAQYSVTFDDETNSNIHKMTEYAADRIIKGANKNKEENKEEYINSSIRLGIESINIFVEKMYMGKLLILELNNYDNRIIGKNSFDWAKDKLCPIWPICN